MCRYHLHILLYCTSVLWICSLLYFYIFYLHFFLLFFHSSDERLMLPIVKMTPLDCAEDIPTLISVYRKIHACRLGLIPTTATTWVEEVLQLRTIKQIYGLKHIPTTAILYHTNIFNQGCQKADLGPIHSIDVKGLKQIPTTQTYSNRAAMKRT